jgi:hypothetical protein
MTSINTVENINANKKIEALWVMWDIRVVRDYNTNEILHYLCYCDSCQQKSVSKDGGFAFATAEELLVHRKMEAFKCPCGCGFHICNQRKVIIGHLKRWHEDVLEMLIADGLYTKQCWIYPDYDEGSYTLTKPDMEGSPLQIAGEILLNQPKRVHEPLVEPKQSKAIIKSDIKAPWANVKRQGVSLNEVMKQQMGEVKENKPIVHYAQEDMHKEKQCENGKDCIHKKLPFRCPFNHDGNGNIIKRGTPLTEDVLCPYERPPFKRCWNTLCTKIHLQNRVEFIEEKKKEYYVGKDGVKKREETTIINISAQGTTMSISREDMMAIAAASSEENLEDTTDSDIEGPHKESKNESDDDLTDITIFASRFKNISSHATA